jgi:hypothetical protein
MPFSANRPGTTAGLIISGEGALRFERVERRRQPLLEARGERPPRS